MLLFIVFFSLPPLKIQNFLGFYKDNIMLIITLYLKFLDILLCSEKIELRIHDKRGYDEERRECEL